MHVLPKNDELVWEVTSADAKLPDDFDLETWLERLSGALASGEFDIPELGLSVPRYPSGSHQPAIYENVIDLVLGHLLPHGHKPLLDLLDALERAYKHQAVAIFLALLVLYADRISDLECARAAFKGLESPASAPYAYINAALQQLARERSGRVLKRKSGIWQYVLDLLAKDACKTAREIWHSIPEASLGEKEEKAIEVWVQPTGQGHDGKRERYWLYRDVDKEVNKDKLVQFRDANSNEQTIEFPTFTKYFIAARKTLANARNK